MNFSIKHIKDEVRSLIAEGKIKGAIDVCKEHSHNFRSKYRKKIILISCRYSRHDEKITLGLSNDESVFMQIADSILRLVNLIDRDKKNSILKKITLYGDEKQIRKKHSYCRRP